MKAYILLFSMLFISFTVNAQEIADITVTTLQGPISFMMIFITPVMSLFGFFIFFLGLREGNLARLFQGVSVLIFPAAMKMFFPLNEIDDNEYGNTNSSQSFTFSAEIITIIAVSVAFILLVAVALFFIKYRSDKAKVCKQRSQQLKILSDASDIYIVHYDYIQQKRNEFKTIMDGVQQEYKKFSNDSNYHLTEKKEKVFVNFIDKLISDNQVNFCSPKISLHK